MSLFDAFTEGWSFRTNKPTFEPGTEISAFITGRENGRYVARIGDTILRVDDSGAGDENATETTAPSADGGTNLVDTRVRLRVEEFDTNDHTGRATVLERLDEGAF